MKRVSTEHWLHVKELFDAALERHKDERAQFLEDVCAGDAELKKEVESLLTSYEQSESFMESPAVESAAEALVARSRLTTGDRLKHYEIVSQLGEGGMGEVYLARDTVLGRQVAIKLLPDYLSSDVDRLRRFKQEARTASALNHPNVCVIHEIGEADDGRPFIAMEYVEGATLRRRMTEQSISQTEALDIAIQIADALRAAHEAGIVHRDIKPENVMVRLDGYVKILDFGLAKLTESNRRGISGTSSTLLMNSIPGMVMGTVGYMSPEQARGVAVDRRTDVWSLGVLIYEMVSGSPPFNGTTPTDIVIAIVEKEQVPLSQQVAQVAPELERIVRKALRKDPEERYQLVKEMGIDLRSLRRDLAFDSQERSFIPSTSSPSRSGGEVRKASTETDRFVAHRQTGNVSPFVGRGRRFGLVLLLTLVLGAGVFWFFKWMAKSELKPEQRFQRINVTKLTTNGNATMAALSPDGKYLAYVVSDAGMQSLWLRQVAITSNVQLVQPRDGRYMGVAFSPDGNFVYFAFAANDPNDQGAAYRIPVLGVGNTATKLDIQHGPSSISHDGKRMAFVHYDRENEADKLMIANADGSGEEEIARRKWPEHFGWGWNTSPAWTANDEALTLPVVNSDATGFFMTIFELILADKSSKIVSLSSQHFAEPGEVQLLSDGSGVMVSAEAYGASFPQIWLLSRDGSARSITNDLSDYRGLSLRADGSAFVTVQRQTLAKIWTLPKGDTEKAIGITAGTSRYFDLCWAPDGKVIYASDASGSADIYEIAAAGVFGPRQLTSDAKRNYSPAVSPDGRYIALHSNRSGIFQIWRMDRDGANPKQLTFGNSESNWPIFSRDGKWVIYQHFESGTPATLWKVPVEGGSPIKVVDGFAIRPAVSPDGKWIAYWQNEGQTKSRWRLCVGSLETDNLLKTFEVAPTVQVQWDTLLRWGSDSRTVTYTDHRGGIDNLWGQSIDGDKPKQLTSFKEGRIFSFDWSAEGNLVLSRGEQTSDVVLISNVPH
ncbi:MAG TPA: protein kinase [Pyrinomonadaceae bacterium]